MENFLGLPPRASVHGIVIDKLITEIQWTMIILFIGWSLYYVYALYRFRQSKNPTANYTGIKSNFVIYLAGIIIVEEMIVLFGSSLPAWADRTDNFPQEKDAVVINVVAEQFAWNIHYHGKDGKFGKRDIALVDSDNPLGLDRTDPDAIDDITTINQLNLPVNKPVIIYVTSKDVIHSFKLPVMRITQDAIPGLKTPVWFTPNVIGEYEIACAQLCGLGHYRMRGYMSIMSMEDFNQWLTDEEANLSL